MKKSGLPNKSILTTEFSFSAKILSLILFSKCKRVCLWVVRFAQWRRKWAVDSISFPKVHKGSTESCKLCLNLCSFKWLKPILRRARNVSPDGLFILKTLTFGLMKFNKSFLKISKEVKFRISRSRLFHSLITVKIKIVPLTYYNSSKKNFWRNYV